VDKVVFLCYVVLSHVILMDEGKVQAILNWPIPLSIHKFMGLQPFIKGSFIILVLLQPLLIIISNKGPLFRHQKHKPILSY